LLSLLDQGQPQKVQLAAVSSLNQFSEPQVGPELVKLWNNFSPRLRSEVLATLLARPDRAIALLKSIEAHSISPGVLGTTQARFLTTHSDLQVRQLAEQVLGTIPSGPRQTVIDSLMPALHMEPRPSHGKQIYEERCSSCHRLGGEGYALGPDLVTVKNTGKEKLLANIIDPNREVRPEFVSYVLETEDGESLVGLIANESATSVTVRQAYGKEQVIPRSQINKMRSQKQSLMPEGLETGLTQQDVADLLGYIETAQPGPK
jgi:putative heme-binding domain-containing protein